jgi:hypothetical protein
VQILIEDTRWDLAGHIDIVDPLTELDINQR